MTVLKLLLVRHGQSVGNAEGRMEGAGSTGLTALGRQQSLHLGQHLAVTGWHPTHFYCSPLMRATETLMALATGYGVREINCQDLNQAGLRVPPLASGEEADPSPAALTGALWAGLKEYDAGIFTGLTWGEASDRHPELCQRLETSLDWQPIPQAETLEQGRTRAERVVDQLLSHHRNGDRILVISHHWILQQIIARLLGCDRAWGLPMGNTACFEFWLDRDRWYQTGPNRLNTELWRIKRFNDTTHLPLPS